MFDSFSRSFGSTVSFVADSDGPNLPEPVDPFFGAIASYEICGCCGNFHAVTDGTDGGGQGVILNADDRGDFGPNGKPSLDPIDAGAQITRSNLSWAAGLGQPAVVTFAFRDTFVSTLPAGTTGHNAFSAAQITATLLALQAWSDVANITFQRVNDGGTQYSESATILFGNYTDGQAGAAAFAYLPGNTAAGAVQGDVWINSSLTYNATPVMQAYGQQVLLHEIGHAIGLSHPANYNAGSGGTITYDGSATYFEDSRQYTVMSYFSETYTGANFGVQRYSAVPLLDDIAAAQRLYGANTTTRTGDTVYGFNSNAGQPWFNANSSASALIFAVWDAGGTDTFDFSGYSVAQTIDLRQGAFSSVGGLTGNVAIAIGVVIENVVGGSGADVIRGNSAANLITSNGGNDQVDGGLGSDTVVFAGARASYTISWNGQVGTVTGLGQTVTVSNVEFLQFSDQTIAAAPTGGLLVGGDITDETITGTGFGDTIGGLGGNDTINGLAGVDTLDGGSGDDILNGGEGDDHLIGGRGDDALNGGAGHDIADFTGAGAGMTLSLAAGTATGGAGADTLTSIEEVLGTAHADTITGDGGANILRGGGGIDTLNGGGGADQLFAGAPGEAGGAPDIVKGQGTANASIGTAVSLMAGFDLGTRSDVENSNTIPHATVVATSHGGMEYYAVTVAAGETVVFDIDNASFDSVLRIFNAANAQLAQNDDNAGQGGVATDSGLSYTFATAGTYYIQVSQYFDGLEQEGTLVTAPPPAGGTYTLHVSVPSAPVVPLDYIGATMNGEAGADVINGGVGRDTLNGGADDDLLNGGGENDTLDGGAGTDTAVFSGDRAGYTISTSGGVTTVTGADGTDSLTNVERLQFADGLFDITGAPVTSGPINGTSNADVLNGTGGDDVINGFDGNDTLNGGGGDDVLAGGAGADTLNGDAGTDTASYAGAYGGVFIDLSTGLGNWNTAVGDVLTSIENVTGTDFLDRLVGDGSANRLDGGLGNDTLLGGGGDDTLIGGLGADAMNGGAGTDTVDYSSGTGAVRVDLALGQGQWNAAEGDTLSGVENLIGTALNDILMGGASVNRLEGGAGDDVLAGRQGGDQLIGGTGNDTVSYAGDYGGVSVNLATGVGSWNAAEGDSLSGIENLIGTDYSDILTGDGSANRLDGGAASDTLNGGGGDDVLAGGAGADTLNGDAGTDTASYAGAYGGVFIDLSTGLGNWNTAVGDVLTSIENVTGTDFLDRLVGDGSANRLDGGLGNDTLLGGGGDDTLIGGLGADAMNGGAGTDTVDYSSGTGAVRVDLALGQGQWNAAEGDTLSGVENLIGTALNDILMGGASVNRLEGGAGDDVLAGRQGGDQLIGGTGNDTVSYAGDYGGVSVNLATGVGSWNAAEGDSLSGIENLIGTDYSDILTGDGSANRLDGGAANDTLNGGGGDDVLAGGAGADTLNGDAGTDTASYAGAYGGVFIDLSTGLGNWNTAVGDVLTSIENVTGTDFLDRLVGDGSANRLDGGLGNDTLLGGGGDDTLIGGLGADAMNGGAGTDTVDYSSGTGAVRVDLALGQGQWNAAEGDTLSGVENLIGTALNDILMGGASVNRLEGGAGDDVLAGRQGGDQLIGGTGNDTVSYAGDYGGVSVNLATGVGSWNAAEGDSLSGIENLIGTDYSDILTGDGSANRLDGGAASDTLNGGGGDDVLAGGAGADTLNGDAGTDTASYAGAYGGVFIDLSTGLGNWNTAVGDVLTSIENVIGTDFLDRLVSNGANNVFTGGGGNDIFVFRDAFGQDRITDFNGAGAAAGDLIVFGGGLFSSFADMMTHAVQVGNDVVITAGANTLTLLGVQRTSLHSNDFDFTGTAAPALAPAESEPQVVPAGEAWVAELGKEGGPQVLPGDGIIDDDFVDLGGKEGEPLVLPNTGEDTAVHLADGGVRGLYGDANHQWTVNDVDLLSQDDPTVPDHHHDWWA